MIHYSEEDIEKLEKVFRINFKLLCTHLNFYLIL